MSCSRQVCGLVYFLSFSCCLEPPWTLRPIHSVFHVRLVLICPQADLARSLAAPARSEPQLRHSVVVGLTAGQTAADRARRIEASPPFISTRAGPLEKCLPTQHIAILLRVISVLQWFADETIVSIVRFLLVWFGRNTHWGKTKYWWSVLAPVIHPSIY